MRSVKSETIYTTDHKIEEEVNNENILIEWPPSCSKSGSQPMTSNTISKVIIAARKNLKKNFASALANFIKFKKNVEIRKLRL